MIMTAVQHMKHHLCDVSVIIPVYNAVQWLDEVLESVCKQDFDGSIEVSIYDDGSCDGSVEKALEWKEKLRMRGIGFVLSSGEVGKQRGAGFARNSAIWQSSGKVLCFLDADDVMYPARVRRQYEVASANTDAIVGSQFVRDPPRSTERYSRWANGITDAQLYYQAYTSHSPTVILPTWAFSRAVFDRIGGFDESKPYAPEDLIFFFKHLASGGRIIRINEILVCYRYHVSAATFSISESSIWDVRIAAVEENVLSNWSSFTIWNAGKQGRRFYRSLTEANQAKVAAFCDVDPQKISRGVYIYEQSDLRPKPTVPIMHFRQANPPFIICVKLDLTGGDFEKNLASLNLQEGVDYFHFS